MLTAITAVAAAVSSLTAFVTIRDARQERRDTAFADLVQARRVALSELGDDLFGRNRGGRRRRTLNQIPEG